MENYTNSEKVDMLLVYGFCQGNGRQSVRVYMERFPNRRIPNHQTFANIERHLRETGSFEKKFEARGRMRTTRTVETEENILERVEEEPSTTTRRLELLEDLIAGLTSNRLIKDIMRPQTAYSQEAVRDIVETIANSSSMKLDPVSMNKLWDLITMVFKWQLTMSSDVLETTQRHLYEVETFVASEGTQLQIHRVQNILENFRKILSKEEKTVLHDDLTCWCKAFNVRVSLLLRMGLQDNDGHFIVNNLEPIAEKMLENIGENIYQVTQNGRILENKSSATASKKSSLDTENVNELKCFVDEMLGERKLSTGSTEGNTNFLRLTLTDSKLNNNPDDRFDSIDVNVNDDKLQTLMTDLNVRDDSEQNSFKEDLLNMIEGDQSDVV